MVSNARRSGLAPFTGIAVAFLLASCASSRFDALPERFGGLPSNAPARPAEPAPFPNVYQPPPTRETKPLTAEEQKKLESDLMALRESQTQQALRANPPPPPPAKKKAIARKQDDRKTAVTRPPEPIPAPAQPAGPKPN